MPSEGAGWRERRERESKRGRGRKRRGMEVKRKRHFDLLLNVLGWAGEREAICLHIRALIRARPRDWRWQRGYTCESSSKQAAFYEDDTHCQTTLFEFYENSQDWRLDNSGYNSVKYIIIYNQSVISILFFQALILPFYDVFFASLSLSLLFLPFLLFILSLSFYLPHPLPPPLSLPLRPQPSVLVLV